MYINIYIYIYIYAPYIITYGPYMNICGVTRLFGRGHIYIYIYIYLYIRRPLGVAKACEMSISFFNPPDPPYLGVLGGGGVSSVM